MNDNAMATDIRNRLDELHAAIAKARAAGLRVTPIAIVKARAAGLRVTLIATDQVVVDIVRPVP